MRAIIIKTNQLALCKSVRDAVFLETDFGTLACYDLIGLFCYHQYKLMDSHPHHKVKLLCILKVSVQTAMNINWPNATCRKVQKVAQCLEWRKRFIMW